MAAFNSIEDRDAIEAAGPYEGLDLPKTLYGYLTRTRDRGASSAEVPYDVKSRTA